MDRLQAEEEKAMAKILRLQKQQALLQQQKNKIAWHSLKYLDELNVAEEKERQEKLSEESCSAYASKASSSVANPFFSNLTIPSPGNPF
ncbi:hypothetical protein B7463_g8434, partial [Scytalidium lignicola]